MTLGQTPFLRASVSPSIEQRNEKHPLGLSQGRCLASLGVGLYKGQREGLGMVLELWQPDCHFENRHHIPNMLKEKERRNQDLGRWPRGEGRVGSPSSLTSCFYHRAGH